MAYEVCITPRAAHEHEEAIAYLAHDLHAPQAAASLATALQNVVEVLEMLPFAYPTSFDISTVIGQEVRYATFKNHLAFYIVERERKRVVVFSIMHMLQNATAHVPDDYQLQ